MTNKILFLETHPIQYRAPIFRELQKLVPDKFEVVYASDFSVRGYKDAGFGDNLAWDTPLLEGYPYRILGNETGPGITKWYGLTENGVSQLINAAKPKAIMLSSLGYRFNWAAYLVALRNRIPIWLRVETQDQAFERGTAKSIVRRLMYRLVYAKLAKVFYIGNLNRQHFIAHGVPDSKLFPALYCTANPFVSMSSRQKIEARSTTRAKLGIRKDAKVIAFFGKLIEKKDPLLLLDALKGANVLGSDTINCLFVGSGPLEGALKSQAQTLHAEKGIQSIFAGFVNQSALPAYYLASDIVVLPSRRMGETWGLVVNEALQAGCRVVISDAVGCAANFGQHDGVEVIPVGDAPALARALEKLLPLPHDFDWAGDWIADYSIEAAARNIAEQIERL